MTLGGVFTVELLSLPPGATKVKGWTMRLVSEQSRTISRMQYPMPNPDGSAPSAGSAPPLRLSFEVGSSVIMAEGAAPKVGYWDSEVRPPQPPEPPQPAERSCHSRQSGASRAAETDQSRAHSRAVRRARARVVCGVRDVCARARALRSPSSAAAATSFFFGPLPFAPGPLPFALGPLRFAPGPPRVWQAEAWKEDDCVWDVEYQAETRTVSFFTIRLASLALLQPSYLEFPYKAWLFSPRGPKSGTLHLVTQRFTFHFDLSAAGVTLRAPRLDQLAALLDTPMAATTLLLRLRSCGINLCPRDADAACLDRVHPKEAHLEAACHEALMPLLPRYQLAASRWNLSRGAAKFMVRLSAMAEPMALADGSDEAGGYSGDGGGEKAAADPFAAIGDWPTLEYGLNRVLMTNALDSDVQVRTRPPGDARSPPLRTPTPREMTHERWRARGEKHLTDCRASCHAPWHSMSPPLLSAPLCVCTVRRLSAAGGSAALVPARLPAGHGSRCGGCAAQLVESLPGHGAAAVRRAPSAVVHQSRLAPTDRQKWGGS